MDELITSVDKAFDMFTTIKSNRIFPTLQQCTVEILKVRGANRYKIPHMKKTSLERKSKLPTRIQCDACLLKDAINWFNSSKDNW